MAEIHSPVSHPARVRFAPSPTGSAHIGNARTAIYNYLLARQTGGQFVLRIEDTDQKRYQPEAEQELVDGLKWLNLVWDEGPDTGGPFGPYRQSIRKNIYQQAALDLIEKGDAYYCFCTPQRLTELRQNQQRQKAAILYDGLCRRIPIAQSRARIEAGESHVIRYKMPREGTITVFDQIRGEIQYENKVLDDFILVKSDGLALYHLAVVVDDHLMEITHVFRGAEWLPTFPLHAHLYRSFGWEEPAWVHLPLFLKPTGKGKLSKRDAASYQKGGHSIFIKDFQSLGYVPEAVVNWLVLMGWGYDDRTEFFTMEDLIEKFSIDRIKPTDAAINFSKLDHFNGLHIRALGEADLAARLVPFFQAAGYRVDQESLRPIVPIIQKRIVTLDDAPRIASFFFQEEITPQVEELVGKDMSKAGTLRALKMVHEIITMLPDFNASTTEAPLRQAAEEMALKPGQLFGILRVAITGQTVSPPLFESMELVGKETVQRRLERAAQLLEEAVAKSAQRNS